MLFFRAEGTLQSVGETESTLARKMTLKLDPLGNYWCVRCDIQQRFPRHEGMIRVFVTDATHPISPMSILKMSGKDLTLAKQVL